jgi:glucose-1-phosphate adenylyltransferase
LPDWTSDTGADMKAQGRNYLASMGIYVFNKDILYKLLNEVHANATDFGKEIIPDSIAHYKVISYQYDGYWTDIGNIYSFFEANIALTDEIPPFNLFDSAKTVFTRSRMLPPAKISGSQINQAIIAEGSIIHAASITKSVIGIRSRIGKDTVIKNSYIMGCDYYETIEQINAKNKLGQPIIGIGERCVIEDAIVDKNCSIGNDVTIRGGAHLEKTDHPLYTIKDNIVVIKKGAIIPNGFVI